MMTWPDAALSLWHIAVAIVSVVVTACANDVQSDR